MTLLQRSSQNPDVHASIDLETLGTGANAVVFEIGAAVIDLSKDEPVKTRCWTFQLHEAMRCGEVTPGTIAWWISDPGIPPGVRERLHRIWAGKDGHFTHGIPGALEGLNTFLADHGPLSIWANGAAFDFPLLRDLFASARRVYERNSRLRPCWGFRDEMCLRPLRRAFSPLWEVARKDAAETAASETGSHAADYDCLVNLLFLSKVNERLPLVNEEFYRVSPHNA